MADPLSLTASILTVAGAATRLGLGLYEIAKALKGAGHGVRAIAADTTLLSRALAELSTTLKSETAVDARACAVADDVVTTC